MPRTQSRYDGHAEWYDAWNKPHADQNAPDLRALLGPGEGPCLDLGCGSGHYFDAIEWLDDGGVRAHPTYRRTGWHQEAPWWGAFIRKRVGMRHHPLADLLNAFIGSGLAVERVAELARKPVPTVLALRARKT